MRVDDNGLKRHPLKRTERVVRAKDGLSKSKSGGGLMFEPPPLASKRRINTPVGNQGLPVQGANKLEYREATSKSGYIIF